MGLMRVVPAALILATFACADTVEPPAVSSIRTIGGEDQAGYVARELRDSLRVIVTDQNFSPMGGIAVTWSTAHGTLSPTQTVTDVSGTAASSWKIANAYGRQTAIAAVIGLPPVGFAAEGRMGVRFMGVEFTPSTVNVASSAGTVSVRVHATDGVLGVSDVYVLFRSPSGQQSSAYVRLNLGPGTPNDGTWQGDVVIPQGAEAGVWTLSRLAVHTHDRETTILHDGNLQYYGMQYQLTVER